MAITGLVYQAYKSAFPELTDEQIVKINDDLELKIPGMADMDPREVAKIAVQLGQNAKAQAAQSPASYAGPASAGRSGYAGTAMAERNAINPQAEHMNAYDPKALDAAYSEYQKKYEATVPERQIRRMMGAGGTELGSRDAATTWGEIDTNNMLQTIGKQAAREAQATAAGKLAEQNLKNFGQQDTNVQNRQKTEGGAIDLKAKQRMNEIGGPMAQILLQSAEAQFEAVNKRKPTAEESKRMASLTPDELAKISTPKMLEAWKEMSAGRTAEATADMDVAVSDAMVNKPGAAATPSDATFNFKPGTNLAVMRATLANSKDVRLEDLAAFDKQFPGYAPKAGGPTLSAEAKERMKYSPIQGAGQTLNPLPSVVAEENADILRRIQKGELVENWNTFGKPSVAKVREMLNNGVYAGKGNVALTAIFPNLTEQQLLLSELAKLNAISPNMFPPALAASLKQSIEKGGFSGGMLPSMSGPALQAMLSSLEADMSRQIDAERTRTSTPPPGGRPSAQPLSPKAQEATSAKPDNEPWTITSQAEYDALPVGAKYRDKDGNSHTKRTK